MRINKYLALATGMSRRAADSAVAQKRVTIEGRPAKTGDEILDGNHVTLDNRAVLPPAATQTIILNKPVGYVCSRAGQGSKTIYDLLPATLHHLKPVGRLDKDSSGLLLLTNDGNLAHQLTHPSFQKAKVYEVRLSTELTPTDLEKITRQGVRLVDGPSKFTLDPLGNQHFEWKITMQEGRNRQIRRTFATLGYQVTRLHRTHFGPHTLGNLAPGTYQTISE